MQENIRQIMLKAGHLSGDSLDYVSGLYEAWIDDPASVPTEWQNYFADLPHINGNPHADVSHANVINLEACLPKD